MSTTTINSTLAYSSVSDGLAVIEHHHSRKTFAAQRQAALVKQRDAVQARLDNLRREIRKIQANAAMWTDEAMLREGIAKLERMGRAEHKLVDDSARLSEKIGG
jgi:cell division protein FtsB